MKGLKEGGGSLDKKAQEIASQERLVRDHKRMLEDFEKDITEIAAGVELTQDSISREDEIAEALLAEGKIDVEFAKIIGRSQLLQASSIEDTNVRLQELRHFAELLETAITEEEARLTELLEQYSGGKRQ
ncbi:hypothetical protein A2704_02925 [Candidatus Kaiserbacteria bacterium RIFCSPHIGHO2_01_FULL_54_36b]|uniref:Uncharacterized protein n=1 Tax=Candidatus Kaiserbacteria bacterium RIFCSPHIGHO2_01_FULL_54_36b TaxID=1798483 RepID=A0A1F6CPT9_9BACT|nr:MAG: hypothetical protein A2704_02925 [Candidatus Kaiserbacteria bacterium RIFCSPHIGHO2_01_FULL_54_36b]